MNNKPLVSVIMPVYESEKFLEISIKSILNQTFKDFELLIVYDKSSDKSLSIIKKFQSLDKRIVLIEGNGKKLIGALNLGFLKSKGEFIARMDADDISLSNRFKKQLNLMKKNKLDICGSHCFLIDKSNKIKGTYFSPITHEMCFLTLAIKVPFAHPSVMIRKKFLKENNLMYGQSNFKIIEDFDLWIRMYKKGAKFGNVDDILFKYRNNKDSLSKIQLKNILKETKELTNNFFETEKNNLKKILDLKKNYFYNFDEQIIIFKMTLKFISKTFNFGFLKYLRHINFKIIIFILFRKFSIMLK